MTLREARDLLVGAFNSWIEDRAPSMGAAIAYYTVFSLAPMLLLVIAIAGAAFGQEAAEGAIVEQLRGLIGRDGALAVQGMIASANEAQSGLLATLIALALLLLAATSVFGELQTSLNVVWKAAPRPGSTLLSLLRTRLLGLSLIVAFAFLLLVSLVISAGLEAFGGYLSRLFPELGIVLRALNFMLSFGITLVLFAIIYKLLPDTRIAWADVWLAAATTSVLFTVGKFAIGAYIGSSDLTSSYGAAAALVVVLIWVYYAAQIFLFGAEFAKVYAELFGSRRHRRWRWRRGRRKGARPDDARPKLP